MNVKDIVALNEKETRAGFGEGIHELAKENSEVVVLTADLAGSFKLGPFIKEFPDRFLRRSAFQPMRCHLQKWP